MNSNQRQSTTINEAVINKKLNMSGREHFPQGTIFQKKDDSSEWDSVVKEKKIKNKIKNKNTKKTSTEIECLEILNPGYQQKKPDTDRRNYKQQQIRKQLDEAKMNIATRKQEWVVMAKPTKQVDLPYSSDEHFGIDEIQELDLAYEVFTQHELDIEYLMLEQILFEQSYDMDVWRDLAYTLDKAWASTLEDSRWYGIDWVRELDVYCTNEYIKYNYFHDDWLLGRTGCVGWTAYIMGQRCVCGIDMTNNMARIKQEQYMFEFLEKTPELLWDIEFISDKGWYTECPQCERCLYKGVGFGFEHCEC